MCLQKNIFLMLLFLMASQNSTYAQFQGINDQAIVKVITYKSVSLEEVYWDDISYPLALPEVGHGSGTIVSSDGVILTAKHVVQSSRFIAVCIPGSKLIYPAQILYKDDDLDFAFLVIEGNFKNQFISLPSTEPSLKKGDEIWAYGYPVDASELEPSITRGIISRFSQNLGLWQMDVSVNPGNSGGPIINKNGEIVGIVTAKDERVQEGMNYALYIDEPLKTYLELKSSSRIESLKRKVSYMDYSEKELRISLAKYIARVTMNPNKFLDEFTNEEILKHISKSSLQKFSNEYASCSVLLSAFCYDHAIRILKSNNLPLTQIERLSGTDSQNFLSLLVSAVFLARNAVEVDGTTKESEYIAAMNKMYDKLKQENRRDNTVTAVPYKPPSLQNPPEEERSLIARTNGFYGLEGGKSIFDYPDVKGWCAGLSLMNLPENSGLKLLINWGLIYEQIKEKLPSYTDYGYDDYGHWKLITVPGESHKTSIYYLTIEPGLNISIGTNPTFFVQGFWMLTGYIFENSDDPELISEAYHLHAGVVLHDVSFSINYRSFLKETLKHDLVSITLGFMR